MTYLLIPATNEIFGEWPKCPSGWPSSSICVHRAFSTASPC